MSDASSERPTVVQFGAGAIGRGFVGQLWCDAGYEVVFVDLDMALIDRLNDRRAYPLRLLPGSRASQDFEITPVRAINGRDNDAVAEALATCDFACTAAGVGAFRSLGAVIARSVARRIVTGNATPFNILCCENQVKAGELLREAVAAALPDDALISAYFDNSVGFVDASVGRMVPPPTPAMRAEDPLLIAAEPYAELPIDGDAWRGPLPAIPGLKPKSHFAAYVARKLFTHNGGHATLAYHGYQRGHEYIWQAAEDPEIIAEVEGFWHETGAALIAAYGFDPDEQRRHEADLLHRFRNRALGDTVVRVARDPLRKLRPDDRLAGAALLCAQWTPDTPPLHVCRALAAALAYDEPTDPTAGQVQATIHEVGIEVTLTRLCGLPVDSSLIPLIMGLV